MRRINLLTRSQEIDLKEVKRKLRRHLSGRPNNESRDIIRELIIIINENRIKYSIPLAGVEDIRLALMYEKQPKKIAGQRDKEALVEELNDALAVWCDIKMGRRPPSALFQAAKDAAGGPEGPAK